MWVAGLNYNLLEFERDFAPSVVLFPPWGDLVLSGINAGCGDECYRTYFALCCRRATCWKKWPVAANGV